MSSLQPNVFLPGTDIIPMINDINTVSQNNIDNPLKTLDKLVTMLEEQTDESYQIEPYDNTWSGTPKVINVFKPFNTIIISVLNAFPSATVSIYLGGVKSVFPDLHYSVAWQDGDTVGNAYVVAPIEYKLPIINVKQITINSNTQGTIMLAHIKR